MGQRFYLTCLVLSILLINVFIHIHYIYTNSNRFIRKSDVYIQNEDPTIFEPAEELRGEFSQIPEHPPFERDMESNELTWPWKEDSQCSRHSVRLGKNIPQILLTSFPRSGNTWLRYMLEGATGIFTGSVYEDIRLIELGYLGEKEDPSAGTVLVVKDHFTKTRPVNESIPVVLIIRNPEHSLISFYTFRTVEKKTAFVDSVNEEIFKTAKFHTMVNKEIKQWELVATRMLTNARYIHVVLYENLKSNPLNEVSKVLKFLRVPEDADRLGCLATHLDGPVNRGQPEFDPYTGHQRKLITEAIQRVTKLMVERGLAPLPYAK